MSQTQSAPFGAWKSPISPDLIVAETISLGDVVIDGDDVYWVESRPLDAGRAVIVRRSPDGRLDDITPPDYSALSRVHEYGGGAFTVHESVVYFVNFTDQGLYRQRPGQTPQALLVIENVRFADIQVDTARGRLICICEDHRQAGEAVNSLVAVALDGASAPVTLDAGADFYACPAVDPDSGQLAWLRWNHPLMPWDGTELWLADIAGDGMLAGKRHIAGGPEESICQPQWSPAGALYFVSDRSGWWNLYSWHEGRVTALRPMQAEFGVPHWVFSQSTYGFDSRGDVICAYNQNGLWQLARLSSAGALTALDVPYDSLHEICCQGDRVVFQGGSPSREAAIVELDLAHGVCAVLRRSSTVNIEAGYIAQAASIEFPTRDGRTAHAFFYPPTNKDYRALDGEKPPLLVKSHGGPTSATSSTLNLGIQFWTSRGFAVLDVNYGGSTGFGRAYHQRLNGQWGVVDVDDCVAAAKYVIAKGWADSERCAIRGNSAGGYTTLAALTFRDLFKAGASYYGVSDLESLAQDTHKFESRYLDRLIGPYPDARDIYQARSPINYTENLAAPVIFFQGLEDKIVPPDQAKQMVAALRAKGIPVAYLAFEGERHGFRKAENIKRALEAELYFYSRIFGFELPEPVAPVAVENLA